MLEADESVISQLESPSLLIPLLAIEFSSCMASLYDMGLNEQLSLIYFSSFNFNDLSNEARFCTFLLMY